MEARGEWKGGFESRLDDGRGHCITVDLPADEGGRNAGASSLELAVLSLAGCINTVFCLVAKRRRLSFSRLTTRLHAERPPGSPTIQRIHGTVEISTAAPRDEVETALRLTLRSCPVGVLLERAHVPVEITSTVVPE